MAVKVTIKSSGETVVGKYAVVDGGQVGLFSGVMSDKKGGFRGCGKKQVFEAALVTIQADNPAKELKTSA